MTVPNMKPYALYELNKDTETKSAWILEKHRGAIIPDFLQTWERGEKKGKQGLLFDEPVSNSQQKFDKMLSALRAVPVIDPKTGQPEIDPKTGKPRKSRATYTGVKIIPEYEGVYCGDYVRNGHNDGILIKISGDKMQIAFFKNMKQASKILLQRLIEGKLSLVCASDCYELTEQQKKEAENTAMLSTSDRKECNLSK